ncbi:MAG: tRNA 2-selenouridine(34) synthase MnmH [Burkholderiaceae bacterium]|nr:tRNA 2-selenouridine(34) synthase MnmH [Burkholderiaceae bacterium]
MSLKPVTADEYLADPAAWDAVIDARSPSEFAEDRLPDALNWPVLDDDERRIVGTTYKQVSALEARKIGAAMAGRRIAGHLDAFIADKPREWRPLVYCWRGGQRSGSLAWFLSQIGFRTGQLQGGYKAFRAVVRAQLDTLPQALAFTVLAGRTGSGKTRLLQALAARGAQVLDLEGLAHHRGSVLGALPGLPQPTQKAFDTRVWQALRGFVPGRPVFVESESARIGSLRVPEALLLRMRDHGRVMRVEMPLASRVQLLLEDYAFFADDVDGFCAKLDTLIELQGRERVHGWQAQARAGQWAPLFERLMAEHYDPLYDRSMRKHFATLSQAPAVPLADGGPAALDAAAVALLTGTD